jgi:[ribosomal protein S5]-alanine N-acetyltransferase
MLENSLRLVATSIYLRPLSVEDVNVRYLSWLQDPEVMSGLATSGYTMANLKDYVSAKIVSDGVLFFAICDNVSHLHIGNIKLDFHDAKANISELGLLIGDKAYWGKGIGEEACRLILDYGFRQERLNKIHLAVYASNPKAKRLYERLGFKEEGCLEDHVLVNDTLYDKYLMAIFKKDWLK